MRATAHRSALYFESRASVIGVGLKVALLKSVNVADSGSDLALITEDPVYRRSAEHERILGLVVN